MATTKPGVFVSRVKFSAGWKDPPHWHPDEVRTVVVLSGTLSFGSGDKWDESKSRAYPAGTFYSEPPRAPHFSWAKDGERSFKLPESGRRERRSFHSNSRQLWTACWPYMGR
jgi:quercetin dioxygenase-like cupin family protein